MKKIKVAIAGIGNCASSLVQGIHYYKDIKDNNELIPGLMHNVLGEYRICDIELVAAFDIDKRKIGKDLSKAIYELPNCTKHICESVPELGITVKMGNILDGVADHMESYPEDQRFIPSDEKVCDVTKELKDKEVDILVSYMPVGSQKATEFYAQCALDAGCGFVNAVPVFIASNEEWAKKFKDAKLPIVGDDIKSQVGATITHRVLTHLFKQRGVTVDRSYQLNFGGNTDFLNMLERKRLKTKKLSKTEAIESELAERLDYDNLHVGPSDYVPFLKDNKVCYIRMEGRKFGNIPINLELRLSVEDSPNSAGVIIDAVRVAKIAKDRGIGGPILSASAYFMKHPPEQFTDDKARAMLEDFIVGKRER